MRWAPSLCVLLLAGCADGAPPAWPARAELHAHPEAADRVRLRWPEAVDDEGVAAYRVSVDGEPRARLSADARDWVAAGLSADGPHRFRVTALDAAGNASDALVTQARTADELPPTFDPEAALEVSLGAPGDSGLRPVQLRWPAASDAVGVEAYLVLVDSERAHRTEERSASLLRPLDGAEVFEVRAVDAAGNESAALYALAPTTDEPPPEPGEGWVDRDAEGQPLRTVALTEVRRVGGARAAEPVRRALHARLPSAGGCYRRALESGPLFDGHLTLELDLRGAGSTRDVRVVGAGLGRSALARCMRSVLRRAVFPQGADGTFRARFEFALAAPEPDGDP